MTKSTFTFPVVSFRHLDTPFSAKGLKNCYAVVRTSDLPQLDEWRKINVRDPKLTGYVPEQIRTNFRDRPDLFVFMNRGLVLSVESATFDNRAGTVTIVLSDQSLHGLLDGGHTYNIVVEETKNLNEAQYLKMEFLEGCSKEDITDVVGARNTSNQVKDESLLNLAGEFDALRVALKNTPYIKHIAFKEYEVDEKTQEPLPIDIREIVAILTAFDRDHFDDQSHPIIAYSSKGQCLKHFRNNLPSFRKIYPLAPQILALHDLIHLKLPELYNNARKQTGGVTGGRFGKLTGVTVHKGKRKTELHYIQKESDYGVPAGLVYPILGAFRALLIEEGKHYAWGLNPEKLLDNGIGQKLADTIGNRALEDQNPSKTGKSPSIWQTCYQAVQIAYLQAPKS